MYLRHIDVCVNKEKANRFCFRQWRGVRLISKNEYNENTQKANEIQTTNQPILRGERDHVMVDGDADRHRRETKEEEEEEETIDTVGS